MRRQELFVPPPNCMPEMTPTCCPCTEAALNYPCPATHRFFNTKPFDYTIHNREICSGLCECAPTCEPYFLADSNGRLCCRRGSFPWSKYLRCLATDCEQKHYCPNLENIPRRRNREPQQCQPDTPCQFDPQCEPLPECCAAYEYACPMISIGNNNSKPCQPRGDGEGCTCPMDNKKLDDGDSDDGLDPNLSPLQRQLAKGLRKLKKIQPPVIWILGHPHETTVKQRETFGKSLATRLGFTFVNMDTEIWNRTATTSEDLADISNDYKTRDGENIDNITKAADARLVLMSWKITSNPLLTLNEAGILEILKLGLIHYHDAKGFVIESFPCSETEAKEFEKMFYPATFAIYIKPEKTHGHRLKRVDASNASHHEELKRLGGILEPEYFRRSHSYHELDVGALAQKYKGQLRALFLDHEMDLGDHEVELAAALVHEKLAKMGKSINHAHPGMTGASPCYNPHCVCPGHGMAPIKKNPCNVQRLYHRDGSEESSHPEGEDHKQFKPHMIKSSGSNISSTKPGLHEDKKVVEKKKSVHETEVLMKPKSGTKTDSDDDSEFLEHNDSDSDEESSEEEESDSESGSSSSGSIGSEESPKSKK